ncbi:MAG: SBBP repeat-containing protein [candidate division WOR-3 bacterium]
MKRWLLLVVLMFFILSILLNILNAQVDTAWVRRYNGFSDSMDCAVAIAVDNIGNVYVTGYSFNQVSNLDYYTIKYDALGQEVWSARYDGPANMLDYPYALAIDEQGNVYVTGGSYGIGVYYDYATIKYNPFGETAWVRRYNGPANDYDEARAIAVDNQGNVYVAGRSYGLTMNYDCLTIKYNSLGQDIWTKRYNGAGNSYDAIYAMTIDSVGNVYVTGTVYNTSSGYDYVTIKYDSLGQEKWVQIYNGTGNSTDYANAIAVDNSGNVYVTGNSSGIGSNLDFLTIKYDSLGQEIWTARYNGPGNYIDHANAIDIDILGNVYVVGATRTSGIGYDYVTIKYNNAGQQVWVQIYNSPTNGDDYAYALKIDNQQNVYVTGYGTFPSTLRDYTTIKYNTQGQLIWIITYNGPANSYDEARAITLDAINNVYVTGTSSGFGPDYATVKYVQGQGLEELITHGAKSSMPKIYPNPAASVVYVCCPWNVNKVTIYDATGKVIKQIALQVCNDNTVRILLEGIKKGVYFIKVNDVMVKDKLVITK